MLSQLVALLVGLARRLFACTVAVPATTVDDCAGFDSEDAMWDDLDAHMEGDWVDMPGVEDNCPFTLDVITSANDIMGVLLDSFSTPTHLMMVDGDVIALQKAASIHMEHDWSLDADTVVATNGSGDVFITTEGFTYQYQRYASMF